MTRTSRRPTRVYGSRSVQDLRELVRRIADDEDLDDAGAVGRIRELVRRPVKVTIGDRSPHRTGHRP